MSVSKSMIEDAVSSPVIIPGLTAVDKPLPSESDALPQAAVIILVDASEKQLLVIHKADFLRRHAGEIAFPGGKLEPDESLLQCAQRECDEEVGLASNTYHLLGRLPRRVTRHKVAVFPFVAMLKNELIDDPSAALKIDRSELQDAFYIPLAELQRPENHRQRVAEIDGEEMQLDYFHYVRPLSVQGASEEKRYKVWGVTAHIIRDLLACDLSQLNREV